MQFQPPFTSHLSVPDVTTSTNFEELQSSNDMKCRYDIYFECVAKCQLMHFSYSVI